jgi:tetratricopeptide (TPR) repeat protein
MRLLCLFLLIACPNFFSNSLHAQEHLSLTRYYVEAPSGESRPVLVRELFRQALLIAAREELGVTTGDEVLADSVDQAAERLVLRPHLHVAADNSDAQFGVYPMGSDQAIWKHETDAAYTDKEIGVLSHDFQEYSRKVFPALLTKLGLKSKPNSARQATGQKIDMEALQTIRDLHQDFEVLPQCLAIQRLHSALKTHGNDVELLGMLAKSYANLFQLTEALSDGLPQALAARALLYGDRVVDLYPDNVQARWSRGYAHTFVGSLLTAEKDLAMETEKQPVWAKVARHVVKFEREALDAMMETSILSDKKFAALGRILVTEGNPIGQIRLAAYQRAEEIMPSNARVLIGIYRETGPGLGTTSIQQATASWRAMISEFKSSPQLPKAVSKANTYRDFISKLDKSSSEAPNELSNSALARILDDMNFWLHAATIRHFRTKIGIETDDMVEECRSRLSGHRHWPLIGLMNDFYHASDIKRSGAFLERLSKVRILDVTPHGMAMNLTQLAWYSKPPNSALPNALNRQAVLSRTSGSAWEFQEFVRVYWVDFKGDAFSKPITDAMIQLLPNSPSAYAYWLNDRWATEKSKVNEARTRFDDPTSIDWVIARKASLERDSGTVIKALERILKVSSDPSVFLFLAETYKAGGDMDKWADTLERSLDFDSPDLAGANTMVKLANHFLNTKDDPLTALRFAKAAAQTGAEWALQCLADVHTALEEWVEAEELIRAIGERYSKPVDWLIWCVTHNQGDFKGAGRAALAYETSIADQRDQQLFNLRFMIRKLAEQKVDNQLRADVLVNAKNSAFYLLVLFEFWEENNLKERDRIAAELAVALEKFEQKAPPLFPVDICGRIIIDLLKTNGTLEQATQKFDEAIKADPQSTSIGFFAGKFIELSGGKKQAIPYFEIGARGTDVPIILYAKLFSRMKLRQLKP